MLADRHRYWQCKCMYHLCDDPYFQSAKRAKTISHHLHHRTIEKNRNKRELKTHVICIDGILQVKWKLHLKRLFVGTIHRGHHRIFVTEIWRAGVIYSIENWHEMKWCLLRTNGVRWRRGRGKYEVYFYDCRCCYYYGNRIILDYLNMADYSCH